MEEQGLRWNAEEKRVEKIRWKPKHRDKYWYLWSAIEVNMSIFDSSIDAHQLRVKAGNCFRTEEQAEKAAEVVKEALRKFHEENE